MKHFTNVLFSVIIIILLTSNCARKGMPTGGAKDSLAPLMITAKPPYKSLNFTDKKIELSFDEYIILKDINQQLVISPPLKYPPIITPQSAASKKITIKLNDTLKPNTTYTFNFGNSVQDNNERNTLERFKYVFSTGSYIDSLKVKGTVLDAFNDDFDKDIKVLLYKVDSTYSDSIIYTKKPNYITSTLDSTLFNITNIAKGKYLLVALKDDGNNYLFNPQEDKIGFLSNFIELPKDSIINNPIRLFKETKKNKFYLPKQISKGKIQFGFDGAKDSIKVELLSDVPSNFKNITKFEPNKDTLNFWHTSIKNDSLVFKVSNQKASDTLTVFLRKKAVDSLKINSNISAVLHLKDTLTFTSNNPVTSIDTTKVTFIDKDSINVSYQFKAEKNTNQIKLLFDKKINDNYKIVLLPGVFTDIFSTKNDSLNYIFKTKEIEDYGSINVPLNNTTPYPVIIELLSGKKQAVTRKKITTKSTSIEFDLLRPREYTIRVIIDENNNGKWDTGNYLKKQMPEKVIYSKEVVNLRPNWHINLDPITIN